MTDSKNPHSGNLGRETEQGSDNAGNLPARIDRYGAAKARAMDMVAYLEADSTPDQSALPLVRLRDCGNWLHFRHYYTVDTVRLHAASFCKQHLICPLCAIRRGAKTLKAYLDRYTVIQTKHQDLKAYMVTLTVKNGDDLDDRMHHLKKSLRKLLRRRNQARTISEARNWSGGFYSVEVTNKGQGWHPHAHMIVLASSEPSETALASEWHTITGDSYIVNVSRREDQEDTELFLEVCKYALKFSDLSLADNWEAALTLRGQRMLGSFGIFRGVDVPESLTDEALDDLPYADLFYRYLQGRGYSFDPSGPPISS